MADQTVSHDPTVSHRPSVIDFDAERAKTPPAVDYEEHRRGREAAEAETRDWMDRVGTHVGAAFLGFACGVAFAWFLDAEPAHLGTMPIEDSRTATSSELRASEAEGGRG